MPKKVVIESNESTFILPFEHCKDVFEYLTWCMVYRPVFTVFVCSSITFAYLISTSQKMQNLLASFPYDRYIAKFKSQKMITVYATFLEVFLELFMTVVLAGVSIIITLWLLFEEVSDRRCKSSEEGKSNATSNEDLIENIESKLSLESDNKIN